MAKTSLAKLGPVVQYVPLGPIRAIVISEDELDALERGSPESIYFNLAVATASFCVSFLTTLLTTAIADTRVFIVFVALATICGIAAITLGCLWWNSKRNSTSIAARIRARFPTDGIGEATLIDEANPVASRTTEAK